MNELEIIRRLIGAVDKAKPRLSRREATAVKEARAFVAAADKPEKKAAPKKKVADAMEESE